ncbi:hypothetical protein HMPREF3145_06915 [Corynebacterium sp. HMSC05C01]|uniref:hypothetical protein n=1 Tax=Corynebacterium sp. HMSC05C01 TaxID=1581113 RepID=UPI0008A58D1B|nr:hypothetical protein [Corynebacterium sp. HMSC05C01]OFT69751.1 hypothetical protein HMPREF3145_06915 [Corynebacterium sp. HMSC05C01]
MIKRATAVLLPLVLAACGTPSEFAGNMPAFEPTRDGTTLSFGDTARVVTEDVSFHVPVQWDVTVGAPKTRRAPRSAEQANMLVCFPVTFTPVAVGEFPVDVTVTLPKLTLVDDTLTANTANPEYCGESTITGYTPDLTGTQHGYVASWSGTADRGVVGTGVEVSTRDATVTFTSS